VIERSLFEVCSSAEAYNQTRDNPGRTPSVPKAGQKCVACVFIRSFRVDACGFGLKAPQFGPKTAQRRQISTMFAAFLSGRRCASDSFGRRVHTIGQQVDTAPCGAASCLRLIDLVGGPAGHYPRGQLKAQHFAQNRPFFHPPKTNLYKFSQKLM
jgi:hypothetical protein